MIKSLTVVSYDTDTHFHYCLLNVENVVQIRCYMRDYEIRALIGIGIIVTNQDQIH